jgi:hypothetical protein
MLMSTVLKDKFIVSCIAPVQNYQMWSKTTNYSTFPNNPLSPKGIYSAFNRGGNRERSVKPEQHLSRIAGVTADSRMSQQR